MLGEKNIGHNKDLALWISPNVAFIVLVEGRIYNIN
jgi:hypothetical protein